MEFAMSLLFYLLIAFAACAITLLTYQFVFLYFERRKFNREMEEFNRAVRAATDYWRDEDGKK